VIAQVLAGIHLLGIAYWLGALVPLRLLSVGGDLPRIARVMKRFGDIALGAVALLIAAGITLLWLLLGSPFAIFDSAYGRLLFAKLLFVAGLLGLAALNKLHLTPRLLMGDESALRALRMSITFELAIALVILTLTATFTTVTGPPALE
jgi:putative copper export protein